MSEKKLELKDLLDGQLIEKEENRIEYVAIIGAGVMGQGIAQTISAAGIDVLIIEQGEEHIHCAQKSLKESMKREIAHWGMTDSEMRAIFSRITWSTEISEVKECDLIIEAVKEDFELKKNIFKKLDEIAEPGTILISNTSTLSLTVLAENTVRPDKIIGVHFLNPVPIVPLVEIVRALSTSDETVSIVKKFAKAINKTPIEVYEYPGFVTTRSIVVLLNEAMYILLEGIASAEHIDTAMKMGYNFPMGPLEMADSMGLDEVLTWMQQLWNSLGEPRYRPCPLLRKMVRERKLGKKVGEGFFKYAKDGKIIYEGVK